MAGIQPTIDAPVGSARTTDATATDALGLSFTIADKSVEVFEIEAYAVRENTSNPLAYSIVKRYSWTRVAGTPTALTSSPTTISEHGDSSMDVAMVLTGGANPVKVQVTGVAATTFNWFIKITHTVLLSN